MTAAATAQLPGVDVDSLRSALADVADVSVAVSGPTPAVTRGAARTAAAVYVVTDRPGADGSGSPGAAPAAAAAGVVPGTRHVAGGFPYRRIRIAGPEVEGVPAGRATDVTVVDADALAAEARTLREHCLFAADTVALDDPAAELLRVLHALHHGQVLWGQDRLDRLQCRTAADFHPLVTTLTAIDRARESWHDLCAARGDDVATADASCRFTEAAVDAVLAWHGQGSPGHRWRLAGLRRLADEQPDLLVLDRLLDGLLPGRGVERPSVEPAVQALRPLFASPLLCTFPETRQLGRDLGELP